MLLVIVRIELLLGQDMVLRCQHVELGVLKDLARVLDFRLSFLDRFLNVTTLLEDSGFLGKFALEFGWLRVEPIVEGHFLAQVGVLPEAETASSNKGSAFEHSHLFVQGCLCGNISDTDLPNLECNWHTEQCRNLVVILLESFVFADVFILRGIVRGIVEAEIVHFFH